MRKTEANDGFRNTQILQRLRDDEVSSRYLSRYSVDRTDAARNRFRCRVCEALFTRLSLHFRYTARAVSLHEQKRRVADVDRLQHPGQSDLRRAGLGSLRRLR